LLDRFDLRVEVPAVSASDLMLPPAKEGSAEVGARVRQARKVQRERFAALGVSHIITNAQCPASLIEQICELKGDARILLAHAAETMALSARGYHRVLKLARTLADLAGRPQPGSEEIAEALGYRVATPSLVA
jgi:magnesium chelatase family protein